MQLVKCSLLRAKRPDCRFITYNLLERLKLLRKCENLGIFFYSSTQLLRLSINVKTINLSQKMSDICFI